VKHELASSGGVRAATTSPRPKFAEMTVQGRIQIDGVAGRSMNTLLTGYDFRGHGDCGTTFRLRRSL